MVRYIFSRKKNCLVLVCKSDELLYSGSSRVTLFSGHSSQNWPTNQAEPKCAGLLLVPPQLTRGCTDIYYVSITRIQFMYTNKYHIIFKVALWSRPRRWFPTLKSQWSATVPEQIEDQIHGEGSLGRLSCESYLNVNWISHAFDE